MFPGVVRYLARGRAWITVRGIATSADGDAIQLGGSLRGDFTPAEGWQLFAGVANGQWIAPAAQARTADAGLFQPADGLAALTSAEMGG